MNAEACSEIAQRATWFVTQTDAGRHADKRTAQRFGVSVRMAQMLRAGQGWTLQRVEQARKSFGPSFDHVVFGPLSGQAGGPSHALAEELAQLESVVQRLAASWRRAPAELVAGGLAPGGSGGADRVADREDRKIRAQGFAGDELDSGDPGRSQAMGTPIKRAAE